MKKRELSVAGLCLFLLGIGVLVLVYFLLNPLFAMNAEKYIFTFIVALVLYASAFLPLVLDLFGGGVAGTAASITVYYKGFSTFGAVSVVNIVLSFMFVPLGYSIAVEAVATFIFVVWIIMALVTKSYIDTSLTQEEEKKSLVMELRSKSRKLASLASGLEKGSIIRTYAEKAADNLQYLSPGNTEEEHDVERKMLAMLDSILMDGYFTEGAYKSPEPLEGKFKNFDMLYRERKNMR